MRTLFALLALAVATLARAQCTPTLTGFQSGPVDSSPASPSFIGALTTFDDGSGAALYAAGNFYMTTYPQGTNGISAARYQRGSWSPISTGLPAGSTQSMRALAAIDLSSVGGPGLSLYAAGDTSGIYRWTGTTWLLTSSVQAPNYFLLPSADAQGPVLLCGGTAGVLSWRGNGAWPNYASFPQGTG